MVPRYNSHRKIQPDSANVVGDWTDLVVARRRQRRGRRLNEVRAIVRRRPAARQHNYQD